MQNMVPYISPKLSKALWGCGEAMPGIGFTVEPTSFLDLSPDRAVTIFRKLLWAEAGRIGIGRHLINVPDCINVGDGGVDAYIDDAHPLDEDVIPQGSSAFQIKSTDLGPTACKKELHIASGQDRPLKEELERRLQRGAAYILVLMASITDASLEARRKAIREELAKCGYPNVQVRIYIANNLSGFTNRHPSLVAALRPELSACYPYQRWGSRREIKHPGTFVADSNRQATLEQIAVMMRERSNCPVLRLTGLPGVGKTRLVYESLQADDLKNQVLYAPSAADVIGSPLLHTLVNDPEASGILVVDECNLQQHRDLTNTLAEQGARLALITMSYEVGNLPMPTIELHSDPLEKKTVEEILQLEYPGLPQMSVGRLAEFADGYPHIAVLLADQYMAEGGSENHFFVHDDYLMNRLIGGSATQDSYQFSITKKVLMGLSLFERIGVTAIGEIEGRWLAEQIGVYWQEFQQVLSREKTRGTIQGDYYAFVTPFMLRIHLMEEWWASHGFTNEASLNEFVSSMPDACRHDLFRRFLDHFPYVSATSQGSKFVQKLLAPEGIASDYEFLDSELGGRLFLALTEADPAAALQAAQRVLGQRSREKLQLFRDGRRAMVESLKRMAVWKELFQPTAKLMLALAEAETESWANNASGEFANLFSVGSGPIAPTEAPPSQRFLILKEALASDSIERRRLGLQACLIALSTGPFHREFGYEYQGIRREPDMWRPATYGELFDAYRSVWHLVRESVNHLEGEDRTQAISVLLSRARSLTRLEPLVDMVVGTIRELASDPSVDRIELIARTVEILHYDSKRMEANVRLKWEQLAEDLSGDDFSSKLERYVAMDLLVDRFDGDGQQLDQAQPHVEELVSQAVAEPSLLDAEFNWLVTKRVIAGHRFGYELCRRDPGYTFLRPILNAQLATGSDADLSFIGGYLEALAESDPYKWESLLDEFAQSADQAGWVVELTWRSGRLTERASRRILELTRTDVTSPEALRLFRYGALIRSLSIEDFSDWVDVLLEVDDLASVSAALDLLVMYGGYNEYREPAERIVCNPAWFRPNTGSHHPSHDSFWWAHVAKALCEHYPDVALEIAQLMLEHSGETGTIVGSLDEEIGQVLDAAVRQKPWELWQVASSMLGPPIDGRAYLIGQWLRGSETFGPGGSRILQEIPQHMIWSWARESPESRPLRLAEFVPKVMSGPQDDPCLARELLLRYGHDPRVRSALRANFSTEGWTGYESQYLSDKLSWLLDLRNQETNVSVLMWINEYIAEIEQRRDYARQAEEREG